MPSSSGSARTGGWEVTINFGALRARLAAARRQGLSFDEAWRRCLVGMQGNDRAVLTATEHAWASGWARQEVYGAASVSALAASLEHEPSERSIVVQRW